jgi:8-oxo-dGTP diphosphatase
MKEIKLINPENTSEEEVKKYPVREASRAVVVDREGKIALLHVTKDNYFKLPGGGIETGEDKISALKRECQEEIGCDIEIVGEIGSIVEYRKSFELKQTSYCYFARVSGEKRTSNFDAGEVAAGFEQVWLPYEEALRYMAENKAPGFKEREYIVSRDLLLLEEARNYLVSPS